MKKCLKCKKAESKCKCKGGFKIIYHFGIPKSKEEMEEFDKLPGEDKSIQISKFMAKRVSELNKQIEQDLKIINEPEN